MNIIGTQFTLKTKAFEIYVAGCNGSPHCRGCHNPESWDFNEGDALTDDMILDMIDQIHQFNSIIKNIMIFGGEPLDQDINELTYLIYTLSQQTHKDIWLFTRYSLDEVSVSIKELCSYIKCGRYDDTKLTDDNVCYGIKLASKNQCIYKKGVDY